MLVTLFRPASGTGGDLGITAPFWKTIFIHTINYMNHEDFICIQEDVSGLRAAGGRYRVE
jgi:hypothetical protein